MKISISLVTEIIALILQIYLIFKLSIGGLWLLVILLWISLLLKSYEKEK